MKKAQQMTTMFPMGFRDDMRVSTTSFSPWARLMTLWGQVSTKAVLVLSLPYPPIKIDVEKTALGNVLE